MSMMRFPDGITYAAKYDPAMGITDQASADLYFDACVEHTMGFGKCREEAEAIERKNIGYWSGYYSHEVRERVERLFKCEYPIFGSIEENGPPTPEQAFGAFLLLAWGQKIRLR